VEGSSRAELQDRMRQDCFDEKKGLSFISNRQRRKEGTFCASELAGIEPTKIHERNLSPRLTHMLGNRINKKQFSFKLLPEDGASFYMIHHCLDKGYSFPYNNNNSLQKRAKANSAQEREKGRASRHRGASGRRGRRKGGNGLGRSRR
jgi:hypothetical protein